MMAIAGDKIMSVFLFFGWVAQLQHMIHKALRRVRLMTGGLLGKARLKIKNETQVSIEIPYSMIMS
jgi:hypothetical protein